MLMKISNILGIAIGIFLIAVAFTPNQSEATGGAGQVAGKIMAILEEAQTYLNEGDTTAAQEELQNAINELKDIYEADEEH
jgi:Tfp pilus assembly protein PilF